MGKLELSVPTTRSPLVSISSSQNLPQSRDAFALSRHSCDQVTVDDHHSFGSARGAAGIHDHRQVRRFGPHYLSPHCRTNKLLLFFHRRRRRRMETRRSNNTHRVQAARPTPAPTACCGWRFLRGSLLCSLSSGPRRPHASVWDTGEVYPGQTSEVSEQ